MSHSAEQTVHGLKACQAVFARRPKDILRIYYNAETAPGLGDLLRWAAGHRLPYRELDDAGLQRVSGSAHHEGLVLTTRPLLLGEALPSWVNAVPLWVALDQVENPHNLGAIVRTCAFFGVSALLVGGMAPGARVSAATLRVAEGGAEHVALYGTESLPALLQQFRAHGAAVVGLENNAPATFETAQVPRPAVLVLGHEHAGLQPATRRVCSALLAIPGSGRVGSLNVSVTAGVALAELTRDALRPGPPPADKPPAPARRSRSGRPPARRPGPGRGGRKRPRGDRRG